MLKNLFFHRLKRIDRKFCGKLVKLAPPRILDLDDNDTLKFLNDLRNTSNDKNMFFEQGIGIQRLSSEVLHNIWVPILPLVEQKRIVVKVNELMQYCEKLKI